MERQKSRQRERGDHDRGQSEGDHPSRRIPPLFSGHGRAGTLSGLPPDPIVLNGTSSGRPFPAPAPDSGSRASGTRSDLLAIFRAGLNAADPVRILAETLRGSRRDGWTLSGEPLLPPPAADEPVHLFGAGKAAASLASGAARALAGERVSGRVIVKRGHGARIDDAVVVEEAGHPLPDEASAAATLRLLSDLKGLPPAARVLLLLTGGASALLAAPAPGISLAEKVRTNALLLRSGADIHEINAVRKHLSAVKGGRLLPLLPEATAALVISDVVGDELPSIGSGPAVPDPTTFADALGVLRRYELRPEVDRAVLRHLERGAEGHVPETTKPPAGEAPHRIPHRILASNDRSVDASVAAARDLGYRTAVFARGMTGNVHQTARRFVAELRTAGAESRDPVALVAGGELTLRVRGSGRGGRNQEFALVAAREMRDGGAGLALLSAGTDGTDGPTDAAGGFADPGLWRRAGALGLDPDAALRSNDSWSVLRATGDLLVTGPTGTNVMDLVVGVATGRQAGTAPG